MPLRALPLLALIAGCATDDPAALPAEQLAPPLTLQVPELVQTLPATLSADGATPGAAVWFLAAPTARRDAWCPPFLGGECVDLVAPVALGHVQADATGHAELVVRVPRALPVGSLVHLQAVVPAGAASVVSGTATREVYDRTCPTTVAAFWAEAADVRACTTAADCGQVLTGTSCGCTRDWVANLTADTTLFYALLADAGQCGVTLASTCDCPPTFGFDCVRDVCTWDYGTP